jgi:hypothetical protein
MAALGFAAGTPAARLDDAAAVFAAMEDLPGLLVVSRNTIRR